MCWSAGVDGPSNASFCIVVILLWRRSSLVTLYRPRNAFLLMALIWLPLKSNVSSLVNAANGPIESSIAQEIIFRLKSNNSRCGVAFIALALMVVIAFPCRFKYFNLDNVWNVPNVISLIRLPERSKWAMRGVNSQQSLPIVWIELFDASKRMREVRLSKPSLFNSFNWLFVKSLWEGGVERFRENYGKSRKSNHRWRFWWKFDTNIGKNYENQEKSI